jgi:hypothetical protein
LIPISESGIFSYRCRDDSKSEEISQLGARIREFHGKKIDANRFLWSSIRIGLQLGERLIFVASDFSVRDITATEVFYYRLELNSRLAQDLRQLATHCDRVS